MILRRVARPLLASSFIFGGINVLRNTQAHAKTAEPFLTGAWIDAAVKIGAGLALASGKAPRLASFVLLGSLVPTTLSAHSFWGIKDPAERQKQMIQFVKNAGLAGGLLLAVGDTEGKPSLGWRARRAAKDAGHSAEKLGRRAEKRAAKLAKKAEKALPH